MCLWWVWGVDARVAPLMSIVAVPARTICNQENGVVSETVSAPLLFDTNFRERQGGYGITWLLICSFFFFPSNFMLVILNLSNAVTLNIVSHCCADPKP